MAITYEFKNGGILSSEFKYTDKLSYDYDQVYSVPNGGKYMNSNGGGNGNIAMQVQMVPTGKELMVFEREKEDGTFETISAWVLTDGTVHIEPEALEMLIGEIGFKRANG